VRRWPSYVSNQTWRLKASVTGLGWSQDTKEKKSCPISSWSFAQPKKEGHLRASSIPPSTGRSCPPVHAGPTGRLSLHLSPAMLPSRHQPADPPFPGAMAEQNGIDILCDAAGSDLLLASADAFPSPSASGAGQHGQPLVKRARRSPPPSIAPTHVCHLCRRVYERADHLTRHLRSHENARQYQCSRCPKRFNRADLLTRHEATHDRESDGGRSMIRRTDRTVEAVRLDIMIRPGWETRANVYRSVLAVQHPKLNVTTRNVSTQFERISVHVPLVSGGTRQLFLRRR